jgi:demethylmenaquinone methyltransferase/2-methoxy-6-polyprenyl-1,4-benzoquinol methylase
MFDNISGNYDNLNRVISFGIDIKWRKSAKIVEAAKPKTILDINWYRRFSNINGRNKCGKIIGLDISAGMLEVGVKKIADKTCQNHRNGFGDSENMPFDDNYFDAITVAFRNFETLEKGLAEILRVLKSGGVFVILETSVPDKTPYKRGTTFTVKYPTTYW